jgi:hypothetical protein
MCNVDVYIRGFQRQIRTRRVVKDRFVFSAEASCRNETGYIDICMIDRWREAGRVI